MAPGRFHIRHSFRPHLRRSGRPPPPSRRRRAKSLRAVRRRARVGLLALLRDVEEGEAPLGRGVVEVVQCLRDGEHHKHNAKQQKYTGKFIEAATAIQTTPITAAITEAAPPNSESPRPGLTLFMGKPSLAINSLLGRMAAPSGSRVRLPRPHPLPAARANALARGTVASQRGQVRGKASPSGASLDGLRTAEMAKATPMATCGTANRQGDHGCPCGTAAVRYAAMKKLPEMAKQRPKQKRGQRISDAGSRRGRFFPGRLRKTMQAREMWPPSMHSTKAGNIQIAHEPLEFRAAFNAPANRMTSKKEPETRIAAHTALTTLAGNPCSLAFSCASSSHPAVPLPLHPPRAAASAGRERSPTRPSPATRRQRAERTTARPWRW